MATGKWAYVVPRFAAFLANLALTPLQTADGGGKKASVVACLNRAYYGHSDANLNSFYIGSWGKQTAIRPPRDVDLYFVLPAAVRLRMLFAAGNAQSALLQEVRRHLLATFGTTQIRGDGPVVLVGFQSYNVEVVPAFEEEQAQYSVCDTKNGGAYKRTAPWHEVVALDSADNASGNDLRPLIRMLKCWQAHCNVPLKSFQLELLASSYVAQCAWVGKGLLFYDFIVRDFFAYALSRRNSYVTIPGTGELVWLGDAWVSRASTAHGHACRAAEYEESNWMYLAGDEWQQIFGSDIPEVV